MTRSSKIEYIYNFQVPKKYKENEQITLNGYWLKIKVGDKVGYIFDKLCLTYKPYLAVKIYNEQYLINYLVKNLKIQLVNDEIEVKKSQIAPTTIIIAYINNHIYRRNLKIN